MGFDSRNVYYDNATFLGTVLFLDDYIILKSLDCSRTKLPVRITRTVKICYSSYSSNSRDPNAFLA